MSKMFDTDISKSFKIMINNDPFIMNSIDLFSLEYKLSSTDGEGGDENRMSNISVTKGEKAPISVQVVPEEVEYSEFTINSEGTYVDVQNNVGVSVDVHGDLSIDADNKIVMFSWDTSKYSVGSYMIVFWISITYNNTSFLIRSETISKAIKYSSVV